MVFQEFSLVPSLTVAQNIFLTVEPLGRGRLIKDREASRRAAEIFREMEVDVDPDAVVERLGTGYWQLTEIAKALAQDARVLIMDEPTASLAKHETEVLFALIGRLKARGISIIYISHRMDEIYRIADRITILRDGRWLLTEALTDVTPQQIVEGIVGQEIEGDLAYERARPADGARPPCSRRAASAAGPGSRTCPSRCTPARSSAWQGLMGSGRTELARCLFGIDPLTAGEIRVRGRTVALSEPAGGHRRRHRADPGGPPRAGPGPRPLRALEPAAAAARHDLAWPAGQRPRRRRACQPTDRAVRRQGGRTRDDRCACSPGGNQQKVVIAKWLGTDPEVLIMDEPTAGVDIGTKSEILAMIRRLADDGKAVIVISSEYPELLAVSDRVLVLREGTVAQELERRDIANEESLQLVVQGVPA